MVNIAIQGINGRMGQVIVALLKDRTNCQLVAGVDIHPNASDTCPVYASVDELPDTVDVLIDFSSPQATKKALEVCAQRKLPAVICTTGLDEQTMDLLKETATKTAIFFSANMSLGINVLLDLIQRAHKILPDFDIEIVEKHHHNKVDAPSGTALMLADGINEVSKDEYHYVYNRQDVRKPRDAKEIGISAVRAGSIVGDHEVIFAGPDEIITLSHHAASRDIFANGAIKAAVYIANKKPGLYSMQNLIDEQ